MKSLRARLSWDVDRHVLGIMAFEASKLMSKVVQMWHCLSDKQMLKLREYVANSIGIKKLVSEDEDYLMNLALAEIIDTFVSMAKSVAVLGKKCVDPIYHNLDGIFDGPSDSVGPPKWYEWRYRPKKMEKRVGKMSKFVAATEQLYSELDVLSELEGSLRQLKASANPGKAKLLEFQQKVEFQHWQVKNLQEISPWVRAYDYVVRLLFRSLSTIMERIRHVNGSSPSGDIERSGLHDHPRYLTRNNSMTRFMQGSSFSVSLGRSLSNLSLGVDKSKLKNRKSRDHYSPSSVFHRKQNQMKVRQFPTLSLNGCVTGGIGSPFIDSYTPSFGSSFRSNGASSRYFGETKDLISTPITHGNAKSSVKASFVDSKRHLLSAPPSTLGHDALALHYANLIVFIERLATSPQSISPDERDDLYDMLTTSIRRGLRAKLEAFSGSSFVCDASLAEEWSSVLTRIFEWLSPLARNMVRWQCERAFERQRSTPGSNVLLVQTLYFADRIATEAAIVELLIGLNYLARSRRRVHEEPFREPSCNRTCEGHCIFFPVIRRTT